MIVKDESAPLDEDRPRVSVTVVMDGKEIHCAGSAYLLAVRDDDGCYGSAGGEVPMKDLAIMSLTASDVASGAAEKAGLSEEYGFELLHLTIDKLQGKLAADEAH